MDGTSSLLGHLVEGLCAAADNVLPKADLSTLKNKQGRLDWLASELIARGVQHNAPGLMAVHQRLRPVIDGTLKRYVPKVKSLKGLLK